MPGDICHSLSTPNGTFYKLRKKRADLHLNTAIRLEALDSANNKRKKILTENLLENQAMKDVLSKMW